VGADRKGGEDAALLIQINAQFSVTTIKRK
jgi:hypothetical protein